MSSGSCFQLWESRIWLRGSGDQFPEKLQWRFGVFGKCSQCLEWSKSFNIFSPLLVWCFVTNICSLDNNQFLKYDFRQLAELWSRSSSNFGCLEPEPEIWVPVPQPYFVKQASCTNSTMVFSFQWTKSFWSLSQKCLDAGAGGKDFRCLEPEPGSLVERP